MTSNEKISFEHKGIGEVLSQNFLEVPLNQREYSWEEEHVRDLFTDYIAAMNSKQGIHFLGTIVLTKGFGQAPEVSDGQQRLATTTILIAAIRDYFIRCGDAKRAEAIESQYLMTTDIATTDTVPRLRLNVDDTAFFCKRVLLPPGHSDRKIDPSQESHKRMAKAAEVAAQHITDIVRPFKDEHKTRQLIRLLEFVNTGAQVIVLRVPDHMNAFMMFETLNDRGLKASQADLLKNYLLGHAKDRIKEAQQSWARMVGVLDSLDTPDIAVTFLHHLLITKYGPTRANDVFDKVKQTVDSQSKALAFLDELAEGANDYVALFNPNHKKWNDYGTRTRKHIATINNDLRVAQIRPLMFAVARHFSVKEAQKAFRRFVFWSVRFLVVGGRGGLLDRNYSQRAQEIGTGTIVTTDALTNALADIIPSDAMFETAFSEARVSQVHLARYYLRALELKKTGNLEPEWIPQDDEQVINLEHVLPENPQENWPDVDTETAAAYYKRIGNMVMLQATKNSIAGNMGFPEKKPILRGSAFVLTSEVGNYMAWGPQQIEERQLQLAKLAVKTWPIKA